MVEDDDMRAAFFEDFGIEVTVSPSGLDSFTITAIFDARPVDPRALKGSQVGFEGGSHNTGNSPQLRCRTIDVEGVKAGRATVKVAGTTFSVWDVKPDYTGLTTFILKVA